MFLSSFILENGPKNWKNISKVFSEKFLKIRTPKQCRERWWNHLDPNIKNDYWAEEEEKIIFEFTKENGTEWSNLSKLLPGRTENAIKNYFYSTIRKNIRRVNKKLILREKIKGTAKEIMRSPQLVDLLYCNTRECMVKAKKLSQEITFDGNPFEIKENIEVIKDLNTDNERFCSKFEQMQQAFTFFLEQYASFFRPY